MEEQILKPLMGPVFRVRDKQELDAFLSLSESSEIVQNSSFEQVFFTLKTLGLADSIDLLQLVTERQVCAFVDLDCWRKDSFVRLSFIEWIAAFAQTGPVNTSRALNGMDEYILALFLKDLIEVFEVDRDDPPTGNELFYSPDQMFAVNHIESGNLMTISSLILDTLFRHTPDLGYRTLRRVRYSTRTDLEETAYQNKTRRLDIHGFVDYYEALSIYTGLNPDDTVAVPGQNNNTDDVPGEESLHLLPTVFADSLAKGEFLLDSLARVPKREYQRLGQELTALGNRIVSANLVNLGDVEGICDAVAEMRCLITIGLEKLSDRRPDLAANLLAANHVQTTFKTGVDELVQLRDRADQFAHFSGFSMSLFESPDREFVAGLRRFKPLLWDGDRYANFETMSDVRDASSRLERLQTLVTGFLPILTPTDMTLRKAFNTAAIQKAISGKFQAIAISSKELENFLDKGIDFPQVELPKDLLEVSQEWLRELKSELKPLVGEKIDQRYVGSLLMRR